MLSAGRATGFKPFGWYERDRNCVGRLYFKTGRLVSINGASALKFNLDVFFNAGLKVDVILMVFFFRVSCAFTATETNSINIVKQIIAFIICNAFGNNSILIADLTITGLFFFYFIEPLFC